MLRSTPGVKAWESTWDGEEDAQNNTRNRKSGVRNSARNGEERACNNAQEREGEARDSAQSTEETQNAQRIA